MIVELGIVLLLSVLTYLGYWYLFLPILIITYWLPKCLVIKLLEYLYPTVLTRFSTNEKVIALTFDDLPHGDHKEIISLLDKYDFKATFFIISGQITEYDKKIFVKAVKNGHQLGNHGRTDSLHALKSEQSLSREIEDCHRIIREIYQEAQVELPERMSYRPGCGVFHTRMLKQVTKAKYKLDLGSVYPNDPCIRIPIINYLYLISHIEPGDVVILHDRSWTLPLLEKLLPWLEEHNYKSVTLNQALEDN